MTNSREQEEEQELISCSRPEELVSVVLPAHPLQVELSPLDLAAERGLDLALTCRASGCLHPPSLTWRRTDQNQTILQRTQQKDGLSLLHLRDLDLQDQGAYSCEAECDSVVRTGDTQIQVLCESDTPGSECVCECAYSSENQFTSSCDLELNLIRSRWNQEVYELFLTDQQMFADHFIIHSNLFI